jgi:hypothetical protein
METIIALIMDMVMIIIIKSTSIVINVMGTSMNTKTISMNTKITSMSTNMNINMEIFVKDTKTKMNSTIIHLKNIHTITIMNMIMETAMKSKIINTLLNQMKKMSIIKKKKIKRKNIKMKLFYMNLMIVNKKKNA